MSEYDKDYTDAEIAQMKKNLEALKLEVDIRSHKEALAS